jgi:hypothetical protein
MDRAVPFSALLNLTVCFCMTVVGAAGLLGVLSADFILGVLFMLGATVLAFRAGQQYGQPRRA